MVLHAVGLHLVARLPFGELVGRAIDVDRGVVLVIDEVGARPARLDEDLRA